MTLALTSPAMATNGYIANGYGGSSKGMAGAGVAVPAGVLGLAQNPAMGNKVGNKAGLCLTTFAPSRSVTVGPGGPLTVGTFKSENPLFLIPCGGVNFRLNDRSSLGIFTFGNGGMNTEYTTNFLAGLGAGTAPLGVNLEQLFLSVNYSYSVNERLTLGIAPVLAIQRFSATGLEAFEGMTSAPGLVTNNGSDWSTGLGLNLGMVWEPTSEWAVGASYRSKIKMQSFDKYAGLFAEGGSFDVPAAATIGAAFTPAKSPEWTFTAEFQRLFYGDIPALANPNAPPQGPLGADNGVGFGWKDVDVVRLAAIYRMNPRWTLRGGLSYATEFIDPPSTVINTLAPATPQWHASAGASYKINDSWGLTMSYTHAFENSITGANPALTGVAQPVTIGMSQHEFAIGMTYKW
ncbi:OmpP1/FadL family transporter [Arenibacterium sp. CAU 1754]